MKRLTNDYNQIYERKNVYMTDNDFAEKLTNMIETVYRVSYSQLPQACDRDDAVQETLLKAWKNRHRMKNERYMQTWVIRILINECHNIHRRKKHESLEEFQIERVAPVDEYADLHDTLFRLDDKYRITIVLHYVEGFDTREISKILSLPQGTVLWRLSKARKELKKMLGEEIGNKNIKISKEVKHNV